MNFVSVVCDFQVNFEISSVIWSWINAGARLLFFLLNSLTAKHDDWTKQSQIAIYVSVLHVRHFLSRKSVKKKKKAHTHSSDWLENECFDIASRCNCSVSVNLKPHINQQQQHHQRANAIFIFSGSWISMVTCWICVTFMFVIVRCVHISKKYCMHTYTCVCN